MCYMPEAQPHDQALLLTVNADVGRAGLGSSFPGYNAQGCAASAPCYSSSLKCLQRACAQGRHCCRVVCSVEWGRDRSNGA
jgi:hypothetical protein